MARAKSPPGTGPYVEYRRAYYQANKERIAAQKRAYRAANREKMNAYARAYKKSPASRAKQKIWSANWRAANRHALKVAQSCGVRLMEARAMCERVHTRPAGGNTDYEDPARQEQQ